jgi:hypothetical protein
LNCTPPALKLLSDVELKLQTLESQRSSWYDANFGVTARLVVRWEPKMSVKARWTKFPDAGLISERMTTPAAMCHTLINKPLVFIQYKMQGKFSKDGGRA